MKTPKTGKWRRLALATLLPLVLTISCVSSQQKPPAVVYVPGDERVTTIVQNGVTNYVVPPSVMLKLLDCLSLQNLSNAPAK